MNSRSEITMTEEVQRLREENARLREKLKVAEKANKHREANYRALSEDAAAVIREIERLRALTLEAQEDAHRSRMEVQSVRAENGKLTLKLRIAEEAVNLIDYTNRSRGYPTGTEWNEIVRVNSTALAKIRGGEK